MFGEQTFAQLRTGVTMRCHHPNDFCIKVGCDDSHFNVSLFVVRADVVGGGWAVGKVAKTAKDSVHKPQILKRKESRS